MTTLSDNFIVGTAILRLFKIHRVGHFVLLDVFIDYMKLS